MVSLPWSPSAHSALRPRPPRSLCIMAEFAGVSDNHGSWNTSCWQHIAKVSCKERADGTSLDVPSQGSYAKSAIGMPQGILLILLHGESKAQKSRLAQQYASTWRLLEVLHNRKPPARQPWCQLFKNIPFTFWNVMQPCLPVLTSGVRRSATSQDTHFDNLLPKKPLECIYERCSFLEAPDWTSLNFLRGGKRRC